MLIYVASIEHKHGTDLYASKTESGIYKQLATYCREWWDDEEVEGSPPEDDKECVQQYFAAFEERWSQGETFHLQAAELED